jgi:hypothetical protein
MSLSGWSVIGTLCRLRHRSPGISPRTILLYILSLLISSALFRPSDSKDPSRDHTTSALLCPPTPSLPPPTPYPLQCTGSHIHRLRLPLFDSFIKKRQYPARMDPETKPGVSDDSPYEAVHSAISPKSEQPTAHSDLEGATHIVFHDHEKIDYVTGRTFWSITAV